MPNSLIYTRPTIVIVALILPVLAGCGSSSEQKTATAACPAERAEFAAAVQALPAAPAASGDAYWQTLHQADPNNAAVAQRLAGELTGLGTSIERIDTGYKTLETCRRNRVAAIRAQIAASTLDAQDGAVALAEEQHVFDAELANGKAAAAQIASRQAILQEAAERLVAAAPGSGSKVAKAVAALPQTATPYMATQSTEIFVRPDAGSARIAALRKGQRVQGPGGGPSAGWTTLTLNDGSMGYVETEVLRPVQPNLSALKPDARTAAAQSADPVVALALTARQTLPAKAQAFASRLESAAAAFTAQPATASSESS